MIALREIFSQSDCISVAQCMVFLSQVENQIIKRFDLCYGYDNSDKTYLRNIKKIY